MKTVDLHIGKSSDDSYLARLSTEDGDTLAEENFRYDIDVSILSRLEDSVGKNIKANAEMIRNFGNNLFNAVFTEAILAWYQTLRNSDVRLRLVFAKEELQLLRIPWEFMFDGEDFLSAKPKMAITRVLKRTYRDVKKTLPVS